MPKQLNVAQQVIRKGSITSGRGSLKVSNKNIALSNLILRGPKTDNHIALTFDGGGNEYGTAQILNILMKYNIHSTFFLTGQWVEAYPGLARQIILEGHEIGNHTYDHTDLTTLQEEQIIRQIILCEQAIRRITGKSVHLFFRQPYGHGDEKVLAATKRAGFDYTIQWSLDTLDWKNPPAHSIVSTILDNVRYGDILLMHLGAHHTAEALEIVAPSLLNRGIQMVTVSKLLFN